MILRTMALALVITVTAAAGCDQSIPSARPCRNIPANGCPLLADGSECGDPSCAAAYACTDGAWTLARTCPGFDAGHADATAPPPAGDAGAAACPDDAGADDAGADDAPPGASGGPGCNALVPPDCPLTRALSCDPASADPCNECDSFFVCEQGAWIFWGGCGPDGGVTLKN